MQASPSFDGIFREWKKSDPATSAAYDRETVDYIVKSEEGKKYWHFFKHMLLGYAARSLDRLPLVLPLTHNLIASHLSLCPRSRCMRDVRSEEHYYISLLYNWPRTKAFVQVVPTPLPII